MKDEEYDLTSQLWISLNLILL